MSGLKYQNPNDLNVSAVLDSTVAGNDSTGSVVQEVRREVVAISDLVGSNLMPDLLRSQKAILAELSLIRYALGKLIGEHLVPDPTALD